MSTPIKCQCETRTSIARYSASVLFIGGFAGLSANGVWPAKWHVSIDFRGRSPAASVGFVTREHRNYSPSSLKVNMQGFHAELPRIGIIALGDER